MIDSTLLGQTAARLMESLDLDGKFDGGKLISVAIVAIAQDEPGETTYTRFFCSDDVFYQQVGILEAGLIALKEGWRVVSPDEDEDE